MGGGNGVLHRRRSMRRFWPRKRRPINSTPRWTSTTKTLCAARLIQPRSFAWVAGATTRGLGSVLGLTAALLLFPRYSASAEGSAILVHKDPNCGCCSGWVRHLKEAGFAVRVDESAELHVVRTRLGVSPDLAACHTAEVNGYVLEGHVPAAALRRLLEERPHAIGLAVPGMPVGSPGMEGGAPQKYEVVLFGASGRQTFMRFIGGSIAG
jgi:hypothetical protein